MNLKQSRDFEYQYEPAPVILNDKTNFTFTDSRKLPKSDRISELKKYEQEGESAPNYH
jgi:hypothetical protein